MSVTIAMDDMVSSRRVEWGTLRELEHGRREGVAIINSFLGINEGGLDIRYLVLVANWILQMVGSL